MLQTQNWSKIPCLYIPQGQPSVTNDFKCSKMHFALLQYQENLLDKCFLPKAVKGPFCFIKQDKYLQMFPIPNVQITQRHT